MSGKEHTEAAGVFRLIEQEGVWLLERTGRKQKPANPDFALNLTQQIYSFSLVPRGKEHFSDINHALQTAPDQLFTSKSITSVQTPTGFRVLLGWTYTEATFMPEEGVDLMDTRVIADEEVETILREKFNIRLKNKLSPKNNKLGYNV